MRKVVLHTDKKNHYELFETITLNDLKFQDDFRFLGSKVIWHTNEADNFIREDTRDIFIESEKQGRRILLSSFWDKKCTIRAKDVKVQLIKWLPFCKCKNGLQYSECTINCDRHHLEDIG